MSFPTSAGNTRSGLEVAMIIGMPNSYMACSATSVRLSSWPFEFNVVSSKSRAIAFGV